MLQLTSSLIKTMNEWGCGQSQQPVLHEVFRWLEVKLTYVIPCFTGGLKVLCTNLCEY